MLRLFIAADLPVELREEVAARMVGVHGARWVKVEQLHITLRFLGDNRDEDLPSLKQRLAAVRRPAFRLRLHGVGVFPETREGTRSRPPPPKVLWIGIEPAAEISALKTAIDDALDVAPRDTAVFLPHLTVARFPARPDSSLSGFLATNQDYLSPDWLVDRFHLYRSTLRREGALHEKLESYPLAQHDYKE